MQETISKLRTMKLTGMAECLEEQSKSTKIKELEFDDRVSLMIDRELTQRNNKRYINRLKSANFKETEACLENVDYKSKRNLSKSSFIKLGQCQFIKEKKDVIFTGATGSGKSWLAQALGHAACEHGFNSKFQRMTKLFNELSAAKATGTYSKFLDKLAKYDVLILDDWGIAPFTIEEARDVFEIIEDRHKTKSTIITSQIPLAKWFEVIGDATIADAIMDRLVNNAYIIDLEGKDSLRKKDPS
ncbi:IS21-like element helper ATPase IstB [Dolichospermum sp. ST_sed1]|nr:IS21-like element helper ATPase IstB [Dolichospermum sp. ST_sed1]